MAGAMMPVTNRGTLSSTVKDAQTDASPERRATPEATVTAFSPGIIASKATCGLLSRLRKLSARRLPGRSAYHNASCPPGDDCNCSSRPAGAPFGETSALPLASIVPTTMKLQAAKKSGADHSCNCLRGGAGAACQNAERISAFAQC